MPIEAITFFGGIVLLAMLFSASVDNQNKTF